MRDYNPKQNNIEKTKNSNKSSSQNKSKLCHQENKFITHRINRKGLVEIKDAQIKSNFCNKIEYPKDKETDDLNKSIKEDNLKKILSFNYDKKSKTNSVSQDLITKILEINKKKYSFGSNTSNFFLYQKEDGSQ